MTSRFAAIGVVCAVLLESGLPALGDGFDVSVTSAKIERFKLGSSETRFGLLEFVGGLEMAGDRGDFGAISAIRFRDTGHNFVAVTDTGFWLTGVIERDAQGRPSGWSSVRMTEIHGMDGKPLASKYEADAEGLALQDDKASVGFERYHRITEFPLTDGVAGDPSRNTGFVVPAHELRTNRGFECVAVSPRDSDLGGARVILSEKSLDKAGNLLGAVLEGPRKGMFTAAKSGVFDVTDCAFLPGGDLVLLERSYSIGRGVGMQLRRIPGSTIKKGAVVDGEILLTANMGYQIDNMEGADIWRAGDGSLHLSLVSDDNHSLLQRNLYLEFRFTE